MSGGGEEHQSFGVVSRCPGRAIESCVGTVCVTVWELRSEPAPAPGLPGCEMLGHLSMALIERQ